MAKPRRHRTGIVWADGARPPERVAFTLDAHGISGAELKDADYRRSCELFAAGGWYRPTQLQELSEQEARVIAARLVRRLEQKISLSAGMAERLANRLEVACAKALAGASATSVAVRRQQIAAALLTAGRDVLEPAIFQAFAAAVALGHRPLPEER